MQEYKNYWLERREARKNKWKRVEFISSSSWLEWRKTQPGKESYEKYRQKYMGKDSELFKDSELLEPEVVFLAYEDRDPEIMKICTKPCNEPLCENYNG